MTTYHWKGPVACASINKHTWSCCLWYITVYATDPSFQWYELCCHSAEVIPKRGDTRSGFADILKCEWVFKGDISWSHVQIIDSLELPVWNNVFSQKKCKTTFPHTFGSSLAEFTARTKSLKAESYYKHGICTVARRLLWARLKLTSMWPQSIHKVHSK